MPPKRTRNASVRKGPVSSTSPPASPKLKKAIEPKSKKSASKDTEQHGYEFLGPYVMLLTTDGVKSC